MSKIGRLIAGFALLSGVAASALFDKVRELVSPLFDVVQSNGILLTLIAAPIILVLLTTLSVAHSSYQRKSRELDEYLRAAQNKAKLDAPTKPKVNANIDVIDEEGNSDNRPIAQPRISQSAAPIFSVIEGGKSKRQEETERRKKAQPAHLKTRELVQNDDKVYFQPVMEKTLSHIAYYEVFRKYQQLGLKSHRFIQFNDEGTDRKRAEFEFALAMSTLASMRPVTNSYGVSLEGMQETRVILPISTALLSQKDIWEKLIDFFEAHLGLTKNILIMIHLRSDRHFDLAILNDARCGLKRLDLLDVKLGLNCEPALLGTIDRSVTRLFCLIAISVELLNAGHALPKSARHDLYCTHIFSEADIVAGLAAGADYLSGDHLAKPRALKIGTTQKFFALNPTHQTLPEMKNVGEMDDI